MKFSVATPSYNNLDWLRLCLASVADQTAEPGVSVEHIVQDAGTPGIEDIAREFGAAFHRDGRLVFPADPTRHPAPVGPQPTYALAIFSEADRGMYDAINRAWQKASGAIISYLNTDEQYLPGTLSAVARLFDSHPHTDLLFGDALLLDGRGQPVSYRRPVKPSRAHTRLVHLGAMSCTMFFRRTWLDRGFFFDPQYRAIGDAEWIWRVLGAGARVRLARQPLAAFALTGQNLGASPKALTEAAAWRDSAPSWQKAATLLWRLGHWMRKAVSGAYAKHAVETATYTLDSPSNRVPLTATALGHHWPQ
jgi:glycosyltransferase involved in cell wall biosynthesis